ncbi:hypothetical protein MRBLWO14_000211 [Microbacterium sp. LWO14-1.2]|uniref:hypothetical protein n=1 Tax=Microbacterium sp. LWO14-1.2 TaxID=3135263 RepID=UPI003139A968
MNHSPIATRASRRTIAVAVILGTAGLVAAGVSTAYIAGMFGLSTAVASQIVNGIMVGGAVLGIALAVASGGLAAVVVATARWAISAWGKKAAIA